MTDQDLTAIGLILDRSGSMSAIRSDAEGGLNQFLDDQRALPGRVLVTFARFNHACELVNLNEPIAGVERLELHPRGNTALLDAVGDTITHMGEAFAAMPEEDRPSKVLVAIVTDGQENSSREWTRQQVFDLITRQRDEWGWEFVFLAANQDAVSEGASLGIHADASLTFAATGAGVRQATASISNYAASYRSTGRGSFDPDPPENPT